MPEEADEPTLTAHEFMVWSGTLRRILTDSFRITMKRILKEQRIPCASITCRRFPVVCLRLRSPGELVFGRGLPLRLKLHNAFRLSGYPVPVKSLRIAVSDQYGLLVYAKPSWPVAAATLTGIIAAKFHKERHAPEPNIPLDEFLRIPI